MYRLVSFTIVGLSIACADTNADTARPTWTASLKSELLARVAADQAARERMVAVMRAGGAPDSATIVDLSAVDSANTAWLQEMVRRHGWPDSATVGADGASAAFLLVQHADRDTAFQARVLPALAAAHRRGQARGQHVAALTDRLARARGEPQVYGTQATLRDGRMVVDPIRDSSGVDLRRAAMGLPPLAEYQRVLDSVYVGRPVP